MNNALIAIVAVIGICRWSLNAPDQQRAHDGEKPVIPVCDPQNTAGKVILSDCPITTLRTL